jgi:hypothetical protein
VYEAAGRSYAPAATRERAASGVYSAFGVAGQERADLVMGLSARTDEMKEATDHTMAALVARMSRSPWNFGGGSPE